MDTFTKITALSPSVPMVSIYSMPERLTKADYLLRENLRALISARRIDAADIAMACGHSSAWISKILNGDREMRIHDIGKTAEFFGLSVSELFHPGISAVTERRKRTRRTQVNRRVTMDRRVQKRTASTTGDGVQNRTPAGMEGGLSYGVRRADLRSEAVTEENVQSLITEATERLAQLRDVADQFARAAKARGGAELQTPKRGPRRDKPPDASAPDR